MELVSGWSDDDSVFVVERLPGSDARRVRRFPARWSAFVTGLDDADRLTLQRTRDVTGLSVRGPYTRIEFRNRWARKDLVYKLQQLCEGVRVAGGVGAVLEADVNPLRRFMSDHEHVTVSTAPRLAWFDLETDSRARFSDAIIGKARILCWSLTAVIADEPRVVASGILEADTDAAEKRLIEDLLIACKPYDVLLAWSGSGFDFPVLESRATAVRARPEGRPPMWLRWCFLDCMEVFKKYHAHVHESGAEKTSFKLNSIAQAVIGEGKDDFQANATWDAWEAGGSERQRLLRYNIKDAMLMPKIEAKTGYIALHIAVCAVTRCFPDTRSLMSTQQGDGFLLRLGEIHNYRWPTKKHTEDFSKYPGAYVMEPTRTGIIENVHVCDFASLYPAIIRSWNISPETVLWKNSPEPPEGVARLPHNDLVKFTNAQRGMLPRALDELVARRAEYSKKQDAAEPGTAEWEHYKRLSGAYKIVANSFYGIMGSAYTRFYSSTAAEAVTQTGAWLIKRVAQKCRESQLEVFYGDTDSVFATGDADAFATVVKELNALWKPTVTQLGCTNCFIKLEYEKSFARIVLLSAKRYIGRFSLYKGKQVTGRKLEVKGIEYKRGDTMRLTREMQKELIDLLLGDATPSADEAHAFVARWKSRVLDGDISIDDIVLSQSVKGLGEYKERFTTNRCGGVVNKVKCGFTFTSTDVTPESPVQCPRCGFERKRSSQPAHVRVAKLLAERGEEMRPGTRVEYLIVSDEDDKIEAVPARDPGALEQISRMTYWAKRIYPPSSRLLESAFPSEQWTETSVQKRQRKKQLLIDEHRGKIDDLPLFAHMHVAPPRNKRDLH